MRGRGRPFKKGEVHNPGGRPRVLRDLQELAREQSPEAIATLKSIMQNGKSPAAARVRACEVLLDRGYGKPMQTTQIAQMSITRRAEDMTDDELATIAAQGLPKAKQAEAKAVAPARASSWNGGDDIAH
jgi:hypothetical protein